MNVEEMIDFLSNFPPDMPLLMEGENEMLVEICPVNSKVEPLILEGEDGEEIDEDVLILRTCTCEIEETSINHPNPEMN